MTQSLMQPRLFHRRRTEGASYWGPGDLYTWLVTGEESGGAYFSMLAVVPPRGGPPPHTHANEDETFYVLDGSPTFRLGEERLVAGPGDFVNVPKGLLHNFRNLSDEPMRMVLTFTPAGIERFFEETLERAYDLTQDCPENLSGSERAMPRRGPGTGWSSSPTPEPERLIARPGRPNFSSEGISGLRLSPAKHAMG